MSGVDMSGVGVSGGDGGTVTEAAGSGREAAGSGREAG